jgi:cysteinylglycine-S-conjugate dipeptidase
LLSFDTSPRGGEHLACVRWLLARLESLGFFCQVHQPFSGAPPLLEAHRPARDCSGHVILYGHYDVETSAAEPGVLPCGLIDHDGRWFGRGVADNKGPLAARLMALARLKSSPALTWFIQGEEETGSAVADQVLGQRLPSLRADLWLDETGYHDHPEGTLRLIARQIGAEPSRSAPPGAEMSDLLEDLRSLASRWDIGTRLEVRGLNKGAVEGGCPFNRHLPVGARYLALGVNDSRSRIHGPDESVPLWTFALHEEELHVVFQWVGRLERSAG